MLSDLRLVCRIHVQTLRNRVCISRGRLQLPHQLQHACKLLRAAPLAKAGGTMRRPLSVSGAGQLHNLLHRYECDVALLQIEPQWHALAVYRQIASFVSCGSQRRRDMHMCAAPAGRQPDLQPCKGPIKQCLQCCEVRTLYYFPARASRPDGWVDCYACLHDMLLAARPPGRCVIVANYQVSVSLPSASFGRILNVLLTAHVSVGSFKAGSCVRVSLPSLGDHALLIATSTRLRCTWKIWLQTHYAATRCQALSHKRVLHRLKAGEHPPTDEPQDCKQCGRSLEA